MTSWTKEPPKEPGWYWARRIFTLPPKIGEPYPAQQHEHAPFVGTHPDREWWPIPISPPQEGAQEE